jgi:hypothetical protein
VHTSPVVIGGKNYWMSELAAKLARRRALNGEPHSDSAPPAPQPAALPSHPAPLSANKTVSGTGWRSSKPPDIAKKPETAEQLPLTNAEILKYPDDAPLKLDLLPESSECKTPDVVPAMAPEKSSSTEMQTTSPVQARESLLVSTAPLALEETLKPLVPSALAQPTNSSSTPAPDHSPPPAPARTEESHKSPPSKQSTPKKPEELKKPHGTSVKKYPDPAASSKLFDPLDSEPLFDSPVAKVSITAATPLSDPPPEGRDPPNAQAPDNSKHSTPQTHSGVSTAPLVNSNLSLTQDPNPHTTDRATASPSTDTSAALDIPEEAPTLRPKRSDLDEFEDFLETIDKDLVGDFRSSSLSISATRPTDGKGVPSPPLHPELQTASSEAMAQENKELKNQVPPNHPTDCLTLP